MSAIRLREVNVEASRLRGREVSVGEVSVGEVSVGEVSVGEVSV
jgi:hypothetical protein